MACRSSDGWKANVGDTSLARLSFMVVSTEAIRISTSASQTVAMPYSGIARTSTQIEPSGL